jgi:hypothetical protein
VLLDLRLNAILPDQGLHRQPRQCHVFERALKPKVLGQAVQVVFGDVGVGESAQVKLNVSFCPPVRIISVTRQC